MTHLHRCGLAALLALLTLPSSAATPTATTAPAASTAATPALPGPVAARQFILVDQATGQTLAAQGEDQRAEPASITKLMTAYVVFKALAEKRLRLDEPVTISERAWQAEGSRTFVEVGKQIPVEVLIKGMIVQSGNDAAIALAERVGGSEPAFAALMNTEAQRLGMRGTRFANATGLPDPGLYSTARDIATLSRAIIRNYPQFYSWYSLREYEYDGIRQPNRNGLLARDAGVDGLKTGHTASAGYCLASSAMRAGTRFVSVVLGAESPRKREEASMLLFEHGFRNFETVRLRKAGDTVLRPRVFKGGMEQVELVPATDVAMTVQRGRASALRTATSVNAPLVAPLKAGQRVGEMQVLDGDRIVQRVPLVTKTAAPEGDLWARLRDTVLLWFQ
jgi:D-alanyl-D-alanine carboxypeptidase (penicillin-binding protein 5/6)